MEGKGKAGFAALMGRPSVGKSTLVNYLCGAKVAITSPLPQTTRNAIRGIITRPEGQLVLVDTPGRHISGRKLNRKLMEVADKALEEVDLVLYVLDAARFPGVEEEAAAAKVALAEKAAPGADKIFAVVNKIDAPPANPDLIEAFLRERLPFLPAERIFRVSALRREGGEALLQALFRAAPEGEPFYPGEYYTDQEVPFRIAEIIREQAILRLREELPQALYVEMADMELRSLPPQGQEPGQGPSQEPRETLWVRAFIVTERESQKGIVVGKGGAMIRSIRLAALRELKSLFDWKIVLDLRVKSSKDWRHNDGVLKRITDQR